MDNLVYFDWITPLYQFINSARGHVSIYGTAADLKKLQSRGIKCRAPMLEPATGMYLWQVTKSDYKRAYQLIHGRSS